MLFLFSLFLFAGRGSGTDVSISSYPDGRAPTEQAEEPAVDFVSPVRDRHCKKMEQNPENHFSTSPNRSVQGDTRNSSFSPQRSAARELLRKNYAFLYPYNEIDHVRQPELGEKCPPVCTAKNNGDPSDSNFFAVDTGALSGQSQRDDDFNEQLSSHIKQKKEKHELVFTPDVKGFEKEYKMLETAIQIQQSSASKEVNRSLDKVKEYIPQLVESYETPTGHLWEIAVNGVSVFVYTLTHHGNQIEDQIRAINTYYLDLLQEFIVDGLQVAPAPAAEEKVNEKAGGAAIEDQASKNEMEAEIKKQAEEDARTKERQEEARRKLQQQEETSAQAQRQAKAKRKAEEEAAQAERARQIEKSRIEAEEAIARFIAQEIKARKELHSAETTARKELKTQEQEQKEREEEERQAAIIAEAEAQAKRQAAEEKIKKFCRKMIQKRAEAATRIETETTARNELNAQEQEQKEREEKEAQTAIKKKTEEEEAAKIAAAQPVTTDGNSFVQKVLEIMRGVKCLFNTGGDGSDEAMEYGMDI